MSRRQLKKLQGYNETEALKKSMGVEDDEIEEVENKPRKNTNFAALLMDDEEDQISEEEVIVKPTLSKKKRNRKNKKKQENENVEPEESFDEIIAKYGFSNGPEAKKANNNKKTKSHLDIEPKFLDPDAELKRIFGSAAVNSDRSNRRTPHRKGRSGVLVSSANVGNLPGGNGGLGCQEDEKQKLENSDLTWWRFTHNKDYQKAQGDFVDTIKSHSHEGLMSILQRHKCHLDSILALSDACRLQDDSQASRSLLERLLFVIENSLHPRCIISSGKCRFDYNRPENRALFGGLFRYALLSGQRGCWRTALEQAKLLLSFDPNNDPLAVVLIIPFFAVRAGKFEELILIEKELKHRKVNELPNWALSVTLALIHLKEDEKAKDKMVNCLKKFPGLLIPLLNAMQAEPCEAIKNSQFFNAPVDLGSKILYDIICKREVEFWKDTKAQQILHKAAEKVLEMNLTARKVNSKAKIPPQIGRHAILSEISIANLRPEQSFLFDPMPPTNPVVEYTPTSGSDGNQIGGFGSLHELFIQSMIPGFEDRLGGNNIQQPIQNLIDSMSNLLEQLRTVPEVPDNNEISHDDEFD